MNAGSTLDHGGPDAQGNPAHDFSTNANACGPCPATLAALQQVDASRYPDPAYTALREQLAAFHSVNPDRIVMAGSASEFIARMTLAVAKAPGCVARPPQAYGDYARAARAHGLKVLSTSALAQDGDTAFTYPLRLVWACDPASPWGTPEPGLAARIEALPDGVPLVLDRAYEPLRLTGKLAVQPLQLSRVWQLWSPNKALGLTGVRGAYAIAPESDAQRALQERLAQLAPSWPLGAHACAMLQSWATASTQAWIGDCRATLRSWKDMQQALCRELGWQVSESDSNYFCADWRDALDGVDPEQALKRMREAGVKLRDCTSFGLPGFMRLGVRAPESQQALRLAWHEVVR